MVSRYKRKTARQSWSLNSMQQAVNAVINGEMGYYRSSVTFGVPQTTLERHVKKQRDNASYRVSKVLGSKKPVFGYEQEKELVAYLKEMEARLFGLTMMECRKLAFQLAEANGYAHCFNKQNEMAGKEWMRKFLERNSELSIRKPEATSGARAMGFNKVAVAQFFKLLQDTLDKYKLTPAQIYNVDETGITVNPKGASKIIALRGKRQVGALTSGERGETITAEICFSAAGAYVPPMLIFPRKRMQQSFLDGIVPGGWVELNDKGWIDMKLFLVWFKKFVEFSKASKDSPVLLLLDGHSSHTKNLDLINYARDNGVILLCYPPHCTHRLQALDVAFMKPLSCYYEDEVRKWLRSNPGRVVTFQQITTLFSNAYLRAATMLTAINGFRKTGVWPVDMNVFSEADFLPSATTDLEIEPLNASDVNVREKTPDENIDPQEGTSKNTDTSFQFVSPKALLPVPHVDRTNTKRTTRRKGKTTILTSSPYKSELEEIQAKNKRCETVKTNRKTVKRIIGDEKSQLNVPKKQKLSKIKDRESDSDSEVSDAECLYCSDLYSTSTEGWICCLSCRRWAHSLCAGMDDEDDEAVFCCELCQ